MFELMPDNMKELAVKSLEALKNGKSIILKTKFHQEGNARKAMLKLLRWYFWRKRAIPVCCQQSY